MRAASESFLVVKGDAHGVNAPPSSRQPNEMPAVGLNWPGIFPLKRNCTTWSGVCAGGRAVIVVSGAGVRERPLRPAGHVGVAAGVERDAMRHFAAAPAQVGRHQRRRAVELGGERVERRGVVRLRGVGGGEVVRERAAGDDDAAVRVDRDRVGGVDVGAAEAGRGRERGPCRGEPRDERVARPLARGAGGGGEVARGRRPRDDRRAGRGHRDAARVVGAGVPDERRLRPRSGRGELGQERVLVGGLGGLCGTASWRRPPTSSEPSRAIRAGTPKSSRIAPGSARGATRRSYSKRPAAP